MNEIAEIISVYDRVRARGQSCVLATVVHLQGSSYRRPGARMLVLDDGTMIGAISGGCLEGDALKKAFLTFSEKQSRLVTYDTSDEEDASVGVQLGCEGVIHILFEYIDTSSAINPLEILRKTQSKRQTSIVVTLFDPQHKKNQQIGTCYVREENGDITSNLSDKNLLELLDSIERKQREAQQSAFVSLEINNVISKAFIEYIEPLPALIIAGAGNDSLPILQIAQTLGWEVTITDARKSAANADRFAGGCQVIVSNPETFLNEVRIDTRTVVVLMTHNFRYDMQLLKAFIKTEVPYIGVLGPRKKLNKMLQELEADGMELDPELLSRIYGPTGLDIGAETAAEIALSIIAEIQAVLKNKNGHMLRLKKDVIHSL